MNNKFEKPKKWDGRWRIVIFDFQKAKKQVRKSIKKKLDCLGFVMVDEAFYVHPFDCFRVFEDSLKGLKVNLRIRYLLVNDINEAKKILTDFIQKP